MELAVLLPIAAFIALAAGLAVVLRGTGRIVARTREAEHFRAAVGDLAARVDASIGSAAEQIDAVRRRQLDPGTIVATIGAATDAVGRYRDEAQAIRRATQGAAHPVDDGRRTGAGPAGPRDGRARDRRS